ncbi:MAG: DUF364 domain-containing protein [Methanocellales archaeon]|nr:DUF364 domain-containing protein [Methanocellales archaeon]
MILEDLLELLQKHAPDSVIEQYCIGGHYTGVKLEKEMGVAYTPSDILLSFELDNITGADAMRTARLALSDRILERTIGIATINALSWGIIPKRYQVCVGDPLKRIVIRDKIVVMVGYFPPVAEQLSSIAKDLRIIERKEMEGTHPSEDAEDVMSDADVIIITGSALIYGGMEVYLQYGMNADEVIVLGPTASMLPDPFFERGATIVAGIQITDPNAALDIISHAGGVHDLIGKCARKVYFRAGRT